MRIILSTAAVLLAAFSFVHVAIAFDREQDYLSLLSSPAESIIYSAPGGDTGGITSGLIADEQGALYGAQTYLYGNGIIFKLTPPALGQTSWTETILYTFPLGSDGGKGISRLLRDRQGALYGTAMAGGLYGSGSVFKLTPPRAGETGWTATTLHSFGEAADGTYPVAGLAADEQGALYGTTIYGGNSDGVYAIGDGIVFKLTPPRWGETEWTETVLYRFGGGNDGLFPYGGLIIDRQGALYGTTFYGGTGTSSDAGKGTVFKLTPPRKGETAWTESILHRFNGGSDGYEPLSELIADTQGVLYGTTNLGGTGSPDGYGGTVFKLTPPELGESSWTESVIYNFKAGVDGSQPVAGLIRDTEGALYGTTGGGGSSGLGTIFRLTPPTAGATTWTETILHSFGGGSDGAFPQAALLPDFARGDHATSLFGTSAGGYAYIASEGTVQLESTSVVEFTLCDLVKHMVGGLPCPAFPNDRQVLR